MTETLRSDIRSFNWRSLSLAEDQADRAQSVNAR